MNTATIYARVSSTGDRQDYTRQVEDLTAYAQRNGLEVVKTFTEKASGAKSRNGGGTTGGNTGGGGGNTGGNGDGNNGGGDDCMG